MTTRRIRDESGFTLVELLMSMVIAAILMQTSFALLIDLRKRAFDAVAIADGRNLMTSVGNAFTLNEDVDLAHHFGDGPLIGATRLSDGGGREPLFKLSDGVHAEIFHDVSGGTQFASASLYHQNGTEDGMNATGRKEFWFMIDEVTSDISVPE